MPGDRPHRRADRVHRRHREERLHVPRRPTASTSTPSKQPDYGHLARLDVEGLEAGKRVDLGEKRSPTDFALWKFSPPGENAADGVGQPLGHAAFRAGTSSARRWRRSTSATTSTSTAAARTTSPSTTPTRSRRPRRACGTRLANFWLHGYFLLLERRQDGEVGRRVPARRSRCIERGYDPLAYRYLCLTAHYRGQLNFTWDALDAAATALDRMRNGVLRAARRRSRRAPDPGAASSASPNEINDDLNVPRALAVAWEVLRGDLPAAVQARDAARVRRRASGSGLRRGQPKVEVVPDAVQALAEARSAARAAKNWAEADRLRGELHAAGWEMEDRADGYALKRAEARARARDANDEARDAERTARATASWSSCRATSRAASRCPRSRARCRRRSTTGTRAAPALDGDCRRARTPAGMPDADAVRTAARDGAAAARLPVGRRLGLRQSRRAGAQRARRDDAAGVLDRSADVPGRLRQHARRRATTSCCADEAWGIDFEAEVAVITGDVPMGAAGADAARAHPAADAGQRRQPAQPDSGRTRQGLRLLPVEAGVGVLAGRGDARRTGRRLARRQGAPAAGVAPQRRAVRPAERRRRHDVRLRPADRAVGEDARRSRPAASSARARCRTRKTAAPAGRPRQAARGYACIAEQRTVETILARQADDAVHALRRPRPHRDAGRGGRTIFGAIDQVVRRAG